MAKYQQLAWAAFLFRYIVGGEDEAYLQTRERLGTDPASTIANLSATDVQELVLANFINRWRCRVTNSPESARAIQEAVVRVKPLLDVLRGARIEAVDFRASIRARGRLLTIPETVDEVFAVLASLGFHFGDTAASKLLHILQPGLFVMWDGPIWYAFQSQARQVGRRFTYSAFLEQMQGMARDVCDDCQQLGVDGDPALHLSASLGYSPPKTLAKYVDEYNWITITRGAVLPPLWHPGLPRMSDVRS